MVLAPQLFVAGGNDLLPVGELSAKHLYLPA
jgi:hypothetical protein